MGILGPHVAETRFCGFGVKFLALQRKQTHLRPKNKSSTWANSIYSDYCLKCTSWWGKNHRALQAFGKHLSTSEIKVVKSIMQSPFDRHSIEFFNSFNLWFVLNKNIYWSSDMKKNEGAKSCLKQKALTNSKTNQTNFFNSVNWLNSFSKKRFN